MRHKASEVYLCFAAEKTMWVSRLQQKLCNIIHLFFTNWQTSIETNRLAGGEVLLKVLLSTEGTQLSSAEWKNSVPSKVKQKNPKHHLPHTPLENPTVYWLCQQMFLQNPVRLVPPTFV